MCVFFFQAEDGIRDTSVTGVQTCALPIYFGGMAGSGRFGEVSVNAACGKDVARLIEQTATRTATVSGFGVVDQQCVLRSEERRVGKECRSRWSTVPS